MQGQIHSVRPGSAAVSVAWNRVVRSDGARHHRARSRRESHEISETLRRIGGGGDDLAPRQTDRAVLDSGDGPRCDRLAPWWWGRE